MLTILALLAGLDIGFLVARRHYGRRMFKQGYAYGREQTLARLQEA